MSTTPFPQCSLPIYHRLTKRINMFLDFTPCISLLIKASYKQEPSECWKLCTLIWERLIKFYMFMAFTSLQDIFPWWYSASDYLPTQTGICSRGQYTGDSAGSLQRGNERSGFGPTLENVLFLYQYESVCRGLNRHADPQSDYFLLSYRDANPNICLQFILPYQRLFL